MVENITWDVIMNQIVAQLKYPLLSVEIVLSSTQPVTWLAVAEISGRLMLKTFGSHIRGGRATITSWLSQCESKWCRYVSEGVAERVRKPSSLALFTVALIVEIEGRDCHPDFSLGSKLEERYGQEVE